MLFEKQDSLGLKGWDSYGQEAGIRDVDAFTSCLARPGTMPMIEKGIEAGKALGVSGIPSVMVSGWLYRGGMSAQALETALRTAAEGGNPR